MSNIPGGRPVVTIAGAVLLTGLAALPGLATAQQPETTRKKDTVTTPTAEQAAAHRKTLEAGHAAFKTAMAKARADGAAARQAFLDKQRVALQSENARVLAEIARRSAAVESPKPN